jgi:hypothetical protein
MKTTHKVRKIKKYLVDIQDDDRFVVGVELDDINLNDRFSTLKTDQTVDVYSPKIDNGIDARRNIIGEYKADKTKPMETCYRANYWTLPNRGGNGYHSGISYIPYDRYPRIFIEPKGIKFTSNNLATGQKILVANAIFEMDKLTEQELSSIKFMVNLLVEAVGEAEIFPLDSITGMPVRVIKTVNWQIIPKGERIWDFIKHDIDHGVSKSEKVMIKERFKALENYLPDGMYKGLDSYIGYVVFYYKAKGLYVFDSIMYGQATYVFDRDWKEVSKLTKKQIIDGGLAKARLIHNKSWKNEIDKLLK